MGSDDVAVRVPPITPEERRTIARHYVAKYPDVQAMFDRYEAALATAEAERDQARELVKYTLAERDRYHQDGVNVLALLSAAEQRVTRLVALEQAARGHGIRVYIRIADLESGLDYTLSCGHGSTHHHIAAAAVETSTGVEKVCQMALAHREQTGCVCAADEEGSRGA